MNLFGMEFVELVASSNMTTRIFWEIKLCPRSWTRGTMKTEVAGFTETSETVY